MADSKKLAIIATKGTLDFAYPPLILATTAAALDWDVTIFWTFYGLQVLKKERNLKISPLGNPVCRCRWICLCWSSPSPLWKEWPPQ